MVLISRLHTAVPCISIIDSDKPGSVLGRHLVGLGSVDVAQAVEVLDGYYLLDCGRLGHLFLVRVHLRLLLLLLLLLLTLLLVLDVLEVDDFDVSEVLGWILTHIWGNWVLFFSENSGLPLHRQDCILDD